MKYVFSLCLLLTSVLVSGQKVEGSGPSPETAFVNAFRNLLQTKIQLVETTEGSSKTTESQERLDTAIGNMRLQVLTNHISKGSENTGMNYDDVFEEVFKISYSDEEGNLFRMDFSIRFDEDQSDFASIEKTHTQTFNMTFEGVLKHLKTQGYDIKHRTEKSPFDSILEERIHYITIEYKKP
ncbi:MAG: hypothetical protein SchgKO_02450 [Schleiferiaceae bacterium]